MHLYQIFICACTIIFNHGVLLLIHRAMSNLQAAIAGFDLLLVAATGGAVCGVLFL